MKVAIILALVLAISSAAWAQKGATGMTPSSISQGGGGGGGGGSVSFRVLPENTHPSYTYEYAHGSAEEFVPSVYVPYEEAVKMGQAALKKKGL
jgi:hypothetical protein